MFSSAAARLSQALPRAITRAGIGNPQKSIHTSILQTKLSHAETLVTHLVNRLLPNRISTALHGIQPGIGVRAISHSPASVRSSIQQNLSFPARVALSSPFHAPRLPRVPALPRTVAHVGLGTARNFSSSRPLFQHLVDNVPVAGRALWEADWDSRCLQEVKNRKFRVNVSEKKSTPPQTKEMCKPAPEKLVLPQPPVDAEEMEHYFPQPALPMASTTILQIPLAPTPTARLPLDMTPYGPELLPLPMIAGNHVLHDDHSSRVAQLFNRLDNARVWDRGASFDALGDRTGLCTALRVKFDGWSESMVREVIGVREADWCTIQEIRHIPFGYDSIVDSPSPPPSEISTAPGSPLLPTSPPPQFADFSSIEFVLPSLDFSSSFPLDAGNQDQDAGLLTRPTSPLFSDSDSDESYSDISLSTSSESDDEIRDNTNRPLGESWFMFSPEFRDRAGFGDDFYF